MKFTILGASGFIGSHLVAHLRSMGIEVFSPGRDDPSVFYQKLGHVIYCIGLTADFRKRPFETVRAHVCHLLDFLERANKIDSLLYLSSTRLYAKSDSCREDTILRVNPTDTDDLYNLSKMMGESVCLARVLPSVRIVRLSNVYGNDFSSTNFLSAILKDAINKKKVILRTALASEKDYISIDDVVNILPQIAQLGRHRLYNIASGVNVSNKALLDLVIKATGSKVEVMEGAELVKFPLIDISKARDEFGFSPSPLHDSFDNLINELKDKSK